MKKKLTPTRGGARAGAGRKPAGRVQITLRLLPSTIDWLRTAAGEHQSISDFLDASFGGIPK